jgi:rare lipoprotein A
MTARHRTLPIGALVTVTNIGTGAVATVRVTDRGPFNNSRCLDVSLTAAAALGMLESGVAQVRIEASAGAGDSTPFTVQAAIYREEESAKQLKWRLSKKFEIVAIVPVETNSAKHYAVRVGSYSTLEKADYVAAKLALDGLEPVILRKDR